MRKWTKYVLAMVVTLSVLLSFSQVLSSAEESDWILPSEVPANAVITATSYSYRESTESTAPSMSGWTANGSYWKESGTGSKHSHSENYRYEM